MTTREVNFDGIVGPTHNYAGLSFGNVASFSNQNKSSSPKSAALQGLAKMKFVADLGLQQCVLPPLARPDLNLLRGLGFSGNPARLMESAWKVNPVWVAACYSASSMWTANAATVSPSVDTADGKLHLTPANLASTLHRSIEPPKTTRVLRALFHDDQHFCVHDPLLACDALADEGAANHTRLTTRHGEPGWEIFVYGRQAMNRLAAQPRKFPARQTREASMAIARRHQLAAERTRFYQQTPDAIDAGVFHNDVISVGNENVLLIHEAALVEQERHLDELKAAFESASGGPLHIVQFRSDELSLADAVGSYFFNSQLISRPDRGMTMVCPLEAQENESSSRAAQRLLDEDNPVDRVEFLDLRQSMNNGGGPACLRLRVVMTPVEFQSMHQGVVLDDALYQRLVDWVGKYYREELCPDDLRDPNLIEETNSALEALCDILGLEYGVLLG